MFVFLNLKNIYKITIIFVILKISNYMWQCKQIQCCFTKDLYEIPNEIE